MSEPWTKVERLIMAAIASQDAAALESALCLNTQLNEPLNCQLKTQPKLQADPPFATPDRTTLFQRLLTQTWHHSHELIIRHLQNHPSPENVEPLRQAIALKPVLAYLDYDDYGAYYKKCLWALAVNPSPIAIEVIQTCTVADDPVLREQANYRLHQLRRSKP